MTELKENPAFPEENNPTLGVQPSSSGVSDTQNGIVSVASVTQTRDPSTQHIKVDVDRLISDLKLESEEMPYLVGEKLSSSNSDENYGSYNPTVGSKCSDIWNSVIQEKPWIQRVRGTTTHLKEDCGAKTLDEATMEAWVADGSDDSLQNQQEEDMKQLLSLDEGESDMEEFKEQEILENHCGKVNNPTVDLLTGDNNASEDSNDLQAPITCDKSTQENASNKSCEENKIRAETKTLPQIHTESYCKESIEYMNKLMNKQYYPPNLEELVSARNEKRTEKGIVHIGDDRSDQKTDVKELHTIRHKDFETNCFKNDCKHHTDCIECEIRKISAENGIRNSSDETNDADINKIFTKCVKGAIDNKESVSSDGIKPSELDSISEVVQGIENLFISPDGKAKGIIPQYANTNGDISLKAVKEAFPIEITDSFRSPNGKAIEAGPQYKNTNKNNLFNAAKEKLTENQQGLESITITQQKLVENCEESIKCSKEITHPLQKLEKPCEESTQNEEGQVEPNSKTKKRVTFADEHEELKKQFQSMEPMIEKHVPDIKQAQETHPDLSADLRFMTEVYPNREAEDALSDITVTESISPRSRKDSPSARGICEELKKIQLKDNQDTQILKHSINRNKSPMRINNQDSTLKQDLKQTEKSNKLTKFCKSFKKKIGKIL